VLVKRLRFSANNLGFFWIHQLRGAEIFAMALRRPPNLQISLKPPSGLTAHFPD
jgi:hypothetical protein